MQYTFVSRSMEDTFNCGHAFARAICDENYNEDVILLLFGDLGAGKTTFMRGVIDGFGGPQGANSPSFNILNIYKAEQRTICHIDAYRDANISWESLMLDDILCSPFCCAIEWPENFHNLPKLPTIKLYLKMFGDQRLLTFSSENEDLICSLIKLLTTSILHQSGN